MSRRHAAGFTLVEMLVAISVLGVTLAAMAACLATGLRVRARSVEHLAFEREARTLVERLRDDVAHVVPAGASPVIGTDALALWRPSTASTGFRPVLVTYQWSVGARGDSILVRVEAPLDVEANDPEAVRAEFAAWTGGTDETARRETVRRRFGDRAERNGRHGRWTGHPHVRSFSFSLSDADDARNGEGARIAVDLVGPRGARVTASVWSDVAVRQPSPAFESTDREVAP